MAIRVDNDADAIYQPNASCPDAAYWAACCWFYMSADDNGFGAIINMDNNLSDYAGLWLFSDGTTFEVTSDSNFNSPGSATPGTWYHVYYINDNGTGRGGFRAAASATYSTQTCSGATTGTGSRKLAFGNDLWGAPPDRIDGRIAWAKVWSGNGTCPTEAEIQMEGYSARPLTKQSGLWGFYPMLDVTTAAVDFSGNGRTLTTAGTLTAEDGPPIGWGAAAAIALAAGASRTHWRPESDISAGGWTASTGSDLFAMVDEETPNDGDYISYA